MNLRTVELTLGDLVIHCDEAGEGERPLVLLHGLTGHRKDFERQLPELAAHGRCLAPDLRGHGDSGRDLEPRGYDFDTMVGDLRELLDQLGIRQMDLLGHSFGGMFALRFTLAHPDRVASLMLMSTSSEAPDGYTRETFVKAGGYATSKGMDQLQARLEELGRGQEEPLPADATADQRDWQARYWAHHKLRLRTMDPYAYGALGVQMMEQAPVTERLPEVTCPSTVIVGAEDIEFVRGAAALAKGLPDVVHHVIPGVGHHPHQESHTRFLEIVGEHLTRAR
ncbi:MAG TPA: alpha/beta hydrolase [Myxococcales bacterium]|nr:alpha/beta hydrolase [Myxococcales bacterium]